MMDGSKGFLDSLTEIWKVCGEKGKKYGQNIQHINKVRTKSDKIWKTLYSLTLKIF
jgi:hypothetical protein